MQANEEEKVTKVKCILCKKKVRQGLNILGTFICHECERRIVTLNVTDEGYDYYIEQLKLLWHRS